MFVWLYAMQVTRWSTVILCHRSPKQEGWNKRKLYWINLEEKKITHVVIYIKRVREINK